MKLPAALALTLLIAAAQTVQAQSAPENPYDIFGRTLAPFVNLFAKNATSPNRAMSADLRLAEAGGKAAKLPPGAAGQTLRLSVQSPDKLRLRAPFSGEEITLVRNGQEVWAVPGSKIEAIINHAEAAGELPKPPKKYKLKPFELPIPEQQLVFLPILFQVKDAGEELVNGQMCRVLDVKLMPELARAMKDEIQEWSARLWVQQPGYKLAKIDLREPRWRVVVAVDRLSFSPSLPAETWKPAPEQTDVLRELGCDMMQGHLLAHPMAPPQMRAWLGQQH